MLVIISCAGSSAVIKRPLLRYEYVRLKIIILIFLLAYGLGIINADNVNISGRVVDNEDKPIEFATVRIAGTAIGTNTDLKGNYELSFAPKDTIELKFSCIGFKEASHKLINPQGNLTLNVKLYPDDYLLDAVEVTAYRSNAIGMQTIDNDSFRLSPDISGGSVEALISSMAGVNSNNEMSSQYSVRGGSFDENSVSINDVEIYRPQLMRSGQQEGLSIINPDMVGDIKFSTGGFPARYPDKMSSALDITYKEPESFEGALSLSLMGGSLTLGHNSGKFSQLHGFRLKKANSVLSSLETRGEYDPLYLDYQTNIIWKPTEKFSVDFLGNISYNDYKFKPRDRETSFGTSSDIKRFKVYFDGNEKDQFETYLGALRLNYRPSRATAFTFGLSAFMTNEYVSYDISGEYWLDQAGTSGSESVGGELGVGKYMEHSRNRLKASVVQATLKGVTGIRGHNLAYGITYQHETFRDRSREWEWRDSAGYSLPTLPEGVHLIYNLSSKEDVASNRVAFYLEDSYYFRSDFASMTLNGGVRLSYWDFNKEFLFSPRVNFTFSPLDHNRWVFRIASGMYYQSPFFKEYRRAVVDELGNGKVDLNHDIKSPLSIQLILGTDYTFRAMNRPFKISAEAYYKNLSRLISYEYDNLKVQYSGTNDSKGYIMGLDLRLFGQFVAGTDSWVSFSLMKTQQTLNGVKTPMPGDQRYSVSLYFTDYFPKFPKLKFSLKGVFSDGLTMTAPRVTRDIAWFRAPAYKRVDVGLSYQLVGAPTDGVRPYNFWRHFKSIIIGFDVFNLFDISNVSSYYWVTDVNNIQYAVPNYLTRRQFNIRLSMEF